MSGDGPSRSLEAGPVQAARRKGVPRAAGNGSRAAVAQTLLAGASGARGDGRGPLGGQRVGHVALSPDLPPEARQFVHLGQGGEVYNVVVAVRAQVRRSLAGLVAVLQED